MEAIAEAAGISRRTFFRYFPSKNDVAWGDFDSQLGHMRRFLAGLDGGLPLREELRLALLDFNTFPAEEAGWHRERMSLLLEVPALQAHSALKYVGWRQVVAEHVARRRGLAPGDHLPRTVGWVLLGVALAAYEQWLDDPRLDLLDLLAAGTDLLGATLGPDPTAR
ncbi:mycofactocin system transcriptional regulator [Rhodococcus aerolatus]